MNLSGATWLKLFTALLMAAAIFLSGLKAGGTKSERESSETNLSVHAGIEFKRKTDRQAQEGGAPSPASTPAANAGGGTAPAVPAAEEPSTPYVGGNYVSGTSTMRYVLEDNNGRVEMYGYDVLRGRSVHVGSGRMIRRQLIIPKFYSFLDDTYGTLKLNLSEDGKTFEGRFEGLNAAQEGRVVLVRLP